MKLKHWVKIIIFAVLATGMLLAAALFLVVPYPRDASGMYGLRLEPEDSVDVALIGASNVYTSFYAPLAYEQEGFTSYPVSVSGMHASLYEAAMEEVLSRQNPDLFVIELWGFQYKNQFDEVVLREFLDVLPLDSPARLRAIETVVPDELRDSFKNPLLKYHGNWTSAIDCARILLDKLTMRRRGFSVTKNYTTTTNVLTDSGKRKYELDETGLKLVDLFLEFCHEKGIEQILFIRGPEQLNLIPQESYFEMLDKIEASGYDFLDMNALQAEIGIDPERDWQHDSHLNIFGAEKYTAFLSNYITDHYDIDTRHSAEVKQEWDYCASLNQDVISFLEKETAEKEDVYRFTQADLLAGVN